MCVFNNCSEEEAMLIVHHVKIMIRLVSASREPCRNDARYAVFLVVDGLYRKTRGIIASG